jgi:hypothetical protein
MQSFTDKGQSSERQVRLTVTVGFMGDVGIASVLTRKIRAKPWIDRPCDLEVDHVWKIQKLRRRESFAGHRGRLCGYLIFDNTSVYQLILTKNRIDHPHREHRVVVTKKTRRKKEKGQGQRLGSRFKLGLARFGLDDGIGGILGNRMWSELRLIPRRLTIWESVLHARNRKIASDRK